MDTVIDVTPAHTRAYGNSVDRPSVDSGWTSVTVTGDSLESRESSDSSTVSHTHGILLGNRNLRISYTNFLILVKYILF